MPTDKPRFSITVDEKLDKAIEDYQHRARAKNKTQAVIQLVELGMDSLINDGINKKAPEPEGSEEQISMDESNRLFDALVNAGLIDDSMNFSDADRAFFGGIVQLINAWVISHRG